ncbi:MAG: PTS sugar transporter subunit IIC [Erysipelotrichaceae bacterium]|nr:PTS sugar transporter subunit IIC [Erysipelotrichaceae bacterium]
MAGAALKICIVYFLLCYIDEICLSWQCLTRPIVIAPLAGLVLGDFRTGIIMGAELEAIFMGISAIGGVIAADATLSSVIAVAYTILTGASITDGVALAFPIGTVLTSVNNLSMSLISNPMAAYWEKLAQKDLKQFKIQNFLFAALMKLIPSVVLFISVAYGVDGLNKLLGTLPPFVMTGLGAASGMMIGVGFAILTAMIWDQEVGIFFFVGYVMVAYLHMDTLAIAILGAACAITMFFSNKRLIDMKNELLNAGVKTAENKNSEEDFF